MDYTVNKAGKNKSFLAVLVRLRILTPIPRRMGVVRGDEIRSAADRAPRGIILCFVTLGVSLNMSSHGVVMGFPSILLPQLMGPHSTIRIDMSSGSWIASATGITLLAGNVLLPIVMARFGRKNANLISLVIIIIGWICIIVASSIPALIFGRLLQGLSLGMSASLGSVLIGEYTSPRNRGAFLASISFAFTIGVLIVHVFGTFLSWKITALICTFITFVNLIIVIYSPESPSWLINKERYNEGQKVFRWLRGDEEEEELRKIIGVKMAEIKSEGVEEHKKISQILKEKAAYLQITMRKVEFYKPVLIMVHLYALGQWSGANILAAYTEDIYRKIIGNDVNVGPIVIGVDVQRIVSNGIAIFVIKKVRRRTVLAVTTGMNVLAYLITAAYCYAKEQNLISFHSSVGIVLIHIHMISIGAGTVPLPFIIAGELFPLNFRGLAGGISVLSMSINLFLTVKTFPFLLTSLGLYGTYCLYASIVFYCLVIALLFLPETKDRTLKDIEDDMKGNSDPSEDIKLT